MTALLTTTQTHKFSISGLLREGEVVGGVSEAEAEQFLRPSAAEARDRGPEEDESQDIEDLI